nr:RND_mfp: efflux transporter, RND family, MFP [uncultured bacterium]
MKTAAVVTPVATAVLLLLSACASHAPPADVPRPIRSVELRYGETRDVNRYFASVQARYEVDQAFRVGGKVTERPVDVGQKVRKGDIVAVLDDVDYRLAEDAARRQLEAANSRWHQTESDWERMHALRSDGSVSDSDEERAKSAFETARAAAKAEARKLELARNQVEYTVLRASRDGVVTNVRCEVGQVIAAGQPLVAIADEGQPEIVADVPEDHLERFKKATFRAALASAPGELFDVELRELSAQAATQTRTYRVRMSPRPLRTLPLGASATLIADHVDAGGHTASIPATALTQIDGKPAVWAARPIAGSTTTARVALVPVEVHGYQNETVLVSGPEEGAIVVTAGVQKMSPGLTVALPVQASPVLADRGAP